MKQGVGLSLSLAWASAASAQRAADDFCSSRELPAAIQAGAALEFAAKAAVAHHHGPSVLFLDSPTFTAAERWVMGDQDARLGMPPVVEEATQARKALLERKTIGGRNAVSLSVSLLDVSEQTPVSSAANLVADARNAAIHLGDLGLPRGELADVFVHAVDAMWGLVPVSAARQWGPYTDIAQVGVLGRRETWQQDKAIRLAQALDRFYTMGTIFILRQKAVAQLNGTTCTICHSSVYFDPACRQPSPTLVPRNEDGTIAVLDCVVCGLTLWGPQIGPPEYRLA